MSWTSAEARLHILEGLLKALCKIDAVIDTIRKSENTETARANLMKRFKLSEIQAQAILDMPLRRLSSLEQKKLDDERNELTGKVKSLKEILGSEERRLAVVVDETQDIKARYADPRRTVIVDAEEGHQAKVTVADLVVPTKSQLVLVTQTGIQRVNAKGFRDTTATRGKATARAVDFPLVRVAVEPDESVALITNQGRIWKGNAGRVSLQATFAELGLEKNERIIGAGVIKPGYKVVLVTRSGNIKRTSIEDLNGRIEGAFAQVIGFENGEDEVLIGGVASDKAEVIIVTAGSDKTTPRALRFEAQSINPQVSATAKGVAAIKMMDDPIIGGTIAEPAELRMFCCGGNCERPCQAYSYQ